MRRIGVVATALASILVFTAFHHPDPTTGTPPDPAEPVLEFRAPASRVTAEDLGRSWRPGCPVPVSRLRDLAVPYWSYAGTRRMGHVIVHQDAVTDVREAFRRLYDRRFQIRQIIPVDHFGASDSRSMRANNTSAFNCRYVAGTTTWSQHSYGRAIDVNPVQNPYVDDGVADPPGGQPWVDRSHGGPGMALPHNVLREAFRAQGWGWGGTWTSAQDYQHFSANNR